MQAKSESGIPGITLIEQKPFGIVVFSHLRWKFVWQRPQQLLSRFAKDHPILFVELTEFDLAPDEEPTLEITRVMPGMTVANIHMEAAAQGTSAVDDAMLRFAKQAMEFENRFGQFDLPLLWYYNPMDVGWAWDKIANRGIVYDCMDELSQFKGASDLLVEREQILLEGADIVFTGGQELWKKKSKSHSNVHCFGCGVEYEHFSQAQDVSGKIPAEFSDMTGPVVGWFGVIDERVDYPLLEELAKLRPNIHFAMVGPVVKVDPESLPQAPNLHWLGGRDYQELPNYCRRFDACMMCFALNEATEFINPTKALEYLATGRPVIGTAVRDVVRQYSDTVLIARSAEEFARHIDQTLATPDEAMIQRGIALAKASSWEAIVDEMQALIKKAIASKVRVAA